MSTHLSLMNVFSLSQNLVCFITLQSPEFSREMYNTQSSDTIMHFFLDPVSDPQ